MGVRLVDDCGSRADERATDIQREYEIVREREQCRELRGERRRHCQLLKPFFREGTFLSLVIADLQGRAREDSCCEKTKISLSSEYSDSFVPDFVGGCGITEIASEIFYYFFLAKFHGGVREHWGSQRSLGHRSIRR